MLRRNKNLKDYLRYCHQINVINYWMILIDCVLFAGSIIQFVLEIQSLKTNILNLIFSILVLISVIWNLRSIFSSIYKIHYHSGHFDESSHVKIATPFIFEEHLLTNNTYEYDFVLKGDNSQLFIHNNKNEIKELHKDECNVTIIDTEDVASKFGIKTVANGCRDTILYSSSINTLLRSNQAINLNSCSCEEKINQYIRQNSDILINFLMQKRSIMRKGNFFNEQKLCLTSEIQHCTIKDSYCVHLSKGEYFNTYLTNEIYSKTLKHDEGSGFELRPTLNNLTYPIKPLNEQVLFSNHIGVSTIAITMDDYLIIVKHNNKTAVTPNYLLPTGSGSADYRDKKQHDTDFKQIVIRVAERELTEEIGISLSDIHQTQIIGFYRDVSRGGKPEFCCVTRLAFEYCELMQHYNSSKSEIFQDPPLNIPYDNGNGINVLLTQNSSISTSLFMNLWFLKEITL